MRIRVWIIMMGFVFSLLTVHVSGQGLNFSQYFNTPMLVNPANTGFNPDFDYRIGGNYRNQWASVGTPFRTMSLWGDTKLFGNRFENGWMGVGAALYSDRAGSGNLVATNGYASVAYHQMLGYNSLLSGGFSVGFINKRIDISKLNFDNQWNGQFFDISIPSNEPFLFSQTTFVDLQVGMNYAYFASDNFYFNLGVSAQHVNRPRESFLSPTTVDARLNPRYTGFLNASIKFEDLWIVNPNIYVSKMGNAWETVLGFNANRNLSGDGEQQMILGLYYRHKDAVIPMVGYQVNDTRFTFNYDATVSNLGNINGYRGAYEISIIKSGIFSNSSNAVKCPTVRF
ncbi:MULTISPECIES: PorP/SprF family type IX secretion system membrane protein [unclassified Sediminibacterium]|jgi:type IX secretion system PorP/SprF family membrane protein|uniref:PorP/SprF family type IX secretion system membrane protein n=1 Tax=unclassified Sediminibacterium TaxID=2635961 RepID=UPI0025D85E4E|nr:MULTISPECIES: PorP/SprF family type IX secretion system membrane protein [unclassified Sediminibacterium]